MMRPMKLAGSELMFGEGCLEYIKTIKVEKVSIVVGGKSMERSGMLAKVEGYFHEAGAETMVNCMSRLQHRPGRRSNYVRGLQSPQWREVCRRVRLRDGHRCQLCGKTYTLEVHHLTYYDEVLFRVMIIRKC